MPSFYSSTSTTIKSKAAGVKSKLPLFALLILGGVAIIFVLRNKSGTSQAGTGAALAIVPTAEGDIGNILNMTAAINALKGQVNTPSPVPNGGASTPITEVANPNNTPTPNPSGSVYPASSDPFWQSLASRPALVPIPGTPNFELPADMDVSNIGGVDYTSFFDKIRKGETPGGNVPQPPGGMWYITPTGVSRTPYIAPYSYPTPAEKAAGKT